MPSSPIIVLDTNVWISGIFFWRGIAAHVLRAWRDGRFDVLFTPQTLDEVYRLLRRKTLQFGAAPTLAEEWIAYINVFAHIVQATGAAQGVCRDPDDDKLLDAAVSGGATILVSSDHDLLSLGEYAGVAILPPAEFAKRLGITLPPLLLDKA